MKKIKDNIFFFILGGILFSTITVLALDTIAANLVTYDNTRSKTNVTTVQAAIDQLYNITIHNGTGITLTTTLPGGISTSLMDGLYRYQGTVDLNNGIDVNNYICFGSNSCTEGTDKTNYLYRIIGIDTDGQMKLIKWASIGDQTWNAAMATDGTGLNGSMFLTNTTYIPTGWDARIASTTWLYLLDSDSTESTIGTRELAATTTNPKSNNADPLKIGLMYVHDYADAYGSTPTYSNTSWIHISKNSVNGASNHEWTISRSGSSNSWRVGSNGSVGNSFVANPSSVRPVFYLLSPIIQPGNAIASGLGTIDNPYILSTYVSS